MPTIDDIGPYKFFFYSAEGTELPHVHIRRDNATAKVWLNPVRVAYSRRFQGHELNKLLKLIEENKDRILEAWHEYFDH